MTTVREGPARAHPATEAILAHFDYRHLPRPMQHVSREIHDLAHWAANAIGDDPELTAGLRKLLEAKDCLVRAVRIAGIRQTGTLTEAEPSPED